MKGNTLDGAIPAKLSVMLRAMPPFVLGLVLVLVFSVELNALPSAGHVDHGSVALPALTPAIGLAAVSSRVARDAMVAVRGSAYYAFALTKGLSPWQALMRHGVRNVGAPVVAYVAVQLVYLVEGVVLVETIFAWPGIGMLAWTAIGKRDYPVILGITLLTGAAIMIVNVLVDIVYALVDPRVSVGGSGGGH